MGQNRVHRPLGHQHRRRLPLIVSDRLVTNQKNAFPTSPVSSTAEVMILIIPRKRSYNASEAGLARTVLR